MPRMGLLVMIVDQISTVGFSIAAAPGGDNSCLFSWERRRPAGYLL
jgi:hypothetical protein